MENHVDYTNLNGDKNVLLIHGMASESAAWNNTKKYLQFKNYNTISLDLSGHGFSKHKDSYSFMGWVDEILDVVETLDIPPHYIIGHSLGGLLAAGVANRSDHVERMLLIDPLLHVPSNLMQFIVKKVMSRFQNADENSLQKSHPTWNKTMIMDELLSFSKWDVKTLEALNSEAGWDIASDFLYNKDRVATTILKPKHSFLLPITYVNALEKYHNINVIEVPKSGHSIHRDNPKNYHELLDTFVANNYRGGSD